MITYKLSEFSSDIEMMVPVLHPVKLNWVQKPGQYMDLYRWCKENCKARFYPWPSWKGNGYEFEDDEDAALFALRWL